MTDRFSERENDPKVWINRKETANNGSQRAAMSKAKKSWKRLKEKIKMITRKTSPIPFEERIQRLNWLMWGWVNYFKNASGYEKFKYLDSWVRCDRMISDVKSE